MDGKQKKSSSSWGCELKYYCVCCACISVRVILFVRMWVEIIVCAIKTNSDGVILFVRMWVEMYAVTFLLNSQLKSSSSWGCELKYRKTCSMFGGLFVILFVRMWVEIFSCWCKYTWLESSSSWGCELKYHPPVGSWQKAQSSSSWGCELKCNKSKAQVKEWNVILFVRMWVEICLVFHFDNDWKSSSSWGCELKYDRRCTCRYWSCHPLREDVSWNMMKYIETI